MRTTAPWLSLSIVAALAATASSAEEIPWTKGVYAALAESRSSGKPVFVDVWAVWCVPCKEMDETTYREREVVEAMRAFVPLKVDQDSSENFCERHDVVALPLVMFLDGEGTEIGRRRGLQARRELLEAMEYVRDGYSGYLWAIGRADEDPEAGAAAAEYLLHAGNSARAVSLLRQAVKNAPDDRAGGLALILGETQLEAADAKAATATFKRLADDAAAKAEIRAQALEGLARALQKRGQEREAALALERLQREFPDLAGAVAPP